MSKIEDTKNDSILHKQKDCIACNSKYPYKEYNEFCLSCAKRKHVYFYSTHIGLLEAYHKEIADKNNNTKDGNDNKR